VVTPIGGPVAEVAFSVLPARRKPGDLWTEPATGLTLVWIPPGEFLMGSSQTEGEPGYDPQARDTELPARRVRISEGFWIGQHPVTNEQYGRFLAEGGRQPSEWRNRRFNAPQQPVVGVSAVDARAFCRWATKRAGLTGEIGFDLPTEGEWEFAARGVWGICVNLTMHAGAWAGGRAAWCVVVGHRRGCAEGCQRQPS
jgi:formylglycine-generating enzyme required for sulfatase activity